MPSNQKKAPKFGDAWKNKKSNPEEMDSLFDKFVHSPKKIESQPETQSPLVGTVEPIARPKADLPDQIEINDQPKDRSFSQPSGLIDPPVQQTPRSQTSGSSRPAGPTDPPVQQARGTIRPEEQTPRSNRSGYLMLPHSILDTLPKLLDPYEMMVYLRLYRLSYGFQRNTCLVGYKGLADGSGLSERHVRRTLPKLIDMGLVKALKTFNEAGKQGTLYEIYAPAQQTPWPDRPPGPTDPPVQCATNKEIDDDDHLNKDHHQSETMRIYQSLTGNAWSKADSAAYQKIRSVSIEAIEQGIRVATARAASRPGSLAYFVKEILAIANPSPASRAQRRRELQAIVDRVRQAHTGQGSYTMVDFSADVKDACAREGVAFNHALFNEIVG